MNRQLFTADWHLDHDKAIEWFRRPFSDRLEMGRELFSQLEKLAQPGGILYYLGDLTMGPRYTKDMLIQISHIVKQWVFVFGNHDEDSRSIIAAHKGIKWSGDIKEIKLYVEEKLGTQLVGSKQMRDYPCVLCHFPMRTWNNSSRGTRHLYGHSHAGASTWRNALDVGVDNAYKLLGQYRPFTAEEVREQIDRINKEAKFEGWKD